MEKSQGQVQRIKELSQVVGKTSLKGRKNIKHGRKKSAVRPIGKRQTTRLGK
jgi:hypothetical protein